MSGERDVAGDFEMKRIHYALKVAFWRLLEIFDLTLGWLLVGIAALLVAPMFSARWLAEKLKGVTRGR